MKPIATPRRAALLTLALHAALAPAALAQEAMYTESATLPSPGTGVLRPEIHIFKYGLNPNQHSNSNNHSNNTSNTSTTVLEANTRISYGIDRGLALSLDIPVEFEWQEQTAHNVHSSTDYDKGVSDLDLMLKARVYREDSTEVDTLRVALLTGASFASGDDHDFSSQSVNPMLGAAVTLIRGRHGFGQDLIYTLNTGGTRESNKSGQGPDDALAFNSAYVYRLTPAEFTSETTGAWYATIEINGLYETNSDTELRLSPGFMYEGRRFGWEIMGQLPLWHDLNERPELDFAIGMGVRITF